MNIESIEKMRNLTRGQMQAGWMTIVKKGETFKFKNIKWTVVLDTEKQLRIKSDSGENITFKRYGNKHTFGAEGKPASFLRDIEGQITMELINANNPFHTFSDIFYLTLRAIEQEQ